MRLPVEQERCDEDPGQAADREDGDEPERVQHRQSNWMLPRQVVATQLKIFTPVGTAMTIDAIMKNAWRLIGRPTVNMWWAQTSIDRKAIATVENAIAL